MLNEILQEFGFGFIGLHTKGHFFQGLFSFHTTTFSPFLNDTFGKLEAAMSVTSAYQERARLNILTVGNWESY